MSIEWVRVFHITEHVNEENKLDRDLWEWLRERFSNQFKIFNASLIWFIGLDAALKVDGTGTKFKCTGIDLELASLHFRVKL